MRKGIIYLSLFLGVLLMNGCGVKGPLSLAPTKEKPKPREIPTLTLDEPLTAPDDEPKSESEKEFVY
jgi:hypothetical protein